MAKPFLKAGRMGDPAFMGLIKDSTSVSSPSDQPVISAWMKHEQDSFTIDSDDGAGKYTATISFVNPLDKALTAGWLFAFETPYEITITTPNVRDVAEIPNIPGYHQIRPKAAYKALGIDEVLSFSFSFTSDKTGDELIPRNRIFEALKMYDPEPIPDDPVVINYAEALQKSFLFWNLQRSGPISDWPDNRLDYIGDTFVTRDVSTEGRKLHGYFDAGDGVLFDMPQAVGMLNLCWSGIEFEQGYVNTGQLTHLHNAAKWGLRYILNGHISETVDDGQGGTITRTAKVYGQVGDGTADHSYQGPPESYPETIEREQQYLDRQNGGGSDLAADKASALAAGSILFETVDPDFSLECLTVAEQLYAFANDFRKPYDETINSAPFHRSGAQTADNPVGDEDEICMAALWLYKATNIQTYLDEAIAIYPGKGPFYNKNELHCGCHVLLYELATSKAEYKDNADKWFYRFVGHPDATAKSLVTFSDEGLAIMGPWGSLAFACNMAFLLEIFTKKLKAEGETYPELYDTVPKRQLDIALGDNNNKFSFVCGISPIPNTERWPKSPHHRRARQRNEFNSFLPNVYTAWGGMVGGPRTVDMNYNDLAKDYEEGELAVNYQSGYTGICAAMAEKHGGTPLTNEELNALEGVTV